MADQSPTAIPLRVLLIEDSEDDAALLARRLRRDGFAPTCRRIDSPAGFAAALRDETAWDVVICDSGVTDLEPTHVRALLCARAPTLPLVIVSGRPPAGSNLPYVSKKNLAMLRPTLERVLARAAPGALLSNAHLERLFELSIDMLCVATVDGYFRRVNPAFERILGHSAADLTSKPFLEFVHPEDRVRTEVEIERLTAGVPTLALENRYRCADGSYKWLSWTAVPGPAGFLYAVARDVTKQKQLADCAAAATAELEAFSYSVSHDLRAPLRAILGFSQALAEDCSDRLDAVGSEHLARIERAGRRMEQLIEDLLGLARIGRQELHPQVIDLSALARDIGAGLRERAPQRRVELTVADGLSTRGDPGLVRVLLENLLDNAWKYSRDRDPARIDVGEVSGAEPPTFYVRDNGVGFDMAQAERLFVPFQRLHREADFEGIGIGLATVRRIVHRHGGRIWAQAGPDAGATFHFTLAPS